MNKSKLLAFFLAFIPGIGHFYINRKRAAIYTLGFFGPIFGGFLLSALSNSEEFIQLGLLFAAFVWGVNLIDMLLTLSFDQMISAPSSVVKEGQQENRNQTERFNAIFLSLVPGLGHLYLGLMSRGISLLTGFFGLATVIIFVTFLTSQSGFLIFFGALPIIWIYAIFDLFQLINRKQRGEEIIDRTIFEDLDSYREDGRKSKLLATLLSMFPGAGHMYLGLQRRGLQLMAAFLLSIYILDVLRLSLFLFLIPIIWFYSFFDALQQVSRYGRGEEMKDVPLVEWLLNHQKWVGIGLLALGGYYLLDQIFLPVIGRIYPDLNLAYWFKSYFQTSLVALLLIGGGIKLVLGKKDHRGEKK